MSGLSAIAASASLASANESTLSLGVRPAAVTSPTSAASTSYTNTSSSREDTVQLSSSAQQYLQAAAQANSNADPTDSTLKNLVKAVAAGDNGALSLLIVI